MYLSPPGRGGGRKGSGCSGRLAPGPLPAPRRAEESGPQFPQVLYHGAATHSHSASRPASPAFSVRGLRASCRLTQLRCWVAPSPEVSCPASEPAHFLRSRSSVRLRRGHTRPLFLHTSAGVNPARSVPGSREAAVPAAGAACVRQSQPHPAPVGLCQAASAAANVISLFGQLGRSCPGRGGRLPTTQCRSLSGSGSLRSPSPCAAKARQPHRTRPPPRPRSTSFRVLGHWETLSRASRIDDSTTTTAGTRPAVPS